MTININETSLQRAKRDTLSTFHTLRFWLFELLSIAVLTILVLLWTPPFIKGMWITVYQILVPLSGVFMGLAIVFIVSLFIAPYKQRNGAWQRIKELEAELEKPKLFDVVCPTASIGLPINRLNDGSYRAAAATVGFKSILIAHRGELTNVTRLTASPEVRFTRADNKGWETTNSIQVTPVYNPLAKPHAMDFTWDISKPRQWVLKGLPLTMAKNELLQLPMMGLSVVDGNDAGTHFESREICTLIVRLAVRTDKGNPLLPDQVIKLIRSDIQDSLANQGIKLDTEKGSSK